MSDKYSFWTTAIGVPTPIFGSCSDYLKLPGNTLFYSVWQQFTRFHGFLTFDDFFVNICENLFAKPMIGLCFCFCCHFSVNGVSLLLAIQLLLPLVLLLASMLLTSLLVLTSVPAVAGVPTVAGLPAVVVVSTVAYIPSVIGVSAYVPVASAASVYPAL
jgi:hypothetical protein